MSYDSWTIVAVKDGPGVIPDEVCYALKRAACDLYLQSVDYHQLLTEACAGYVETDWDVEMLGSKSGVLFRAKVEAISGEYRVNFLLNAEDLKRGARRLRDTNERLASAVGAVVPCKALYDFSDLREVPRRRVLH